MTSIPDDVHCPVSTRTFSAMRLVDVHAIGRLSEPELRPVLPSLVRMALCVPIDAGDEWLDNKKQILMRLSSSEKANSIVSLLSVDFHVLDGDVRKEMQIRSRPGEGQGEHALTGSMSEGLIVEFERSSAISKFRIVLSEFVAMQCYARSLTNQAFGITGSTQRSSELLDNEVYLNEICDVLVIAIVELPTSMNLIEVVETLIFTKRGPDLICRLVANFPESFHEVCSAIILNSEKQDEDLIVSKNRIKALRMLCKMNPDKALAVRSVAIESCRMPGLTVLITIDYQKMKGSDERGNELVSFVSSILLGGEEKTKLWFSQYLRMGQKKIDQNSTTTVSAMRRHLLLSIKRHHQLLKNGELSDSQIVQTAAILRLYCALRAMASINIKFNDEEAEVILNVITSMPPLTASGVKLVSLFLCVFICCPSLISTPQSDRRAVAWLQNLVQSEVYFGQVGHVKSSFEEMLLLIAIHFHSCQFAAISDLVCSFMGMKLQIRSTNLNRLKVIFTQDIFPEEKVALHAVKVPVTSDLNANIAAFLPAHCIYQLLKSRAFSKHKVPVREWIFRQVCSSKPPIHPIMPLMIEAYVNSIMTPNSKSMQSATDDPISESDLMSIFKHQIFSGEAMSSDAQVENMVSDLLTTQLLLLYYLLLFRDVWLTQCKQHALPDVSKYSAELLSQVPVFYLIQEARKDQTNFGVLFPPLLRLTTAHESHLCLVSDWLNSASVTDSDAPKIPKSDLLTIGRTLNSEMIGLPLSAKSTLKLLDHVLTLPHSVIWSLAPCFVPAMPALLRPGVPKIVLEKCKQLWWRLNSIFPDNLWIATVNALRQGVSDSRLNLPAESVRGLLTWNDVVMDPLCVLRCDERVSRCPELMEITLHMLNAFLAASRTMFNSHLMEKVSKNSDEEKDREELKAALVASQESAAIQILLECCIVTPEEVECGMLHPVREVQGLICTHLHQVFISDPNLAKLVHFQTYSSELLPLTVSAIPSMHICLDFLHELLSQPDLSKCVFAIELCSYLSLQYSTTKCLCAAKLCFNVSSTLLSLLSSEKRSSFFMPVLPALTRMCTAFPPLKDDAILLMKQLRQVSISKLAACSCTFISPKSLSRAYSLAKVKYPQTEAFLRFCASLPDDEALYLIIHDSMDRLERSPDAC